MFARGKLKFKLFLNDLWYEPETLWFWKKLKKKKKIKFLVGNIFLYRGITLLGDISSHM